MRPHILLPAVLAPALAAGADGGARFGFDELAALIETHDVRRIEDLLPRLPQELRAGYTLVYRSRSLQGASPERPRVILFGRDARLIVAFNGDPAHPRHDELEILHYRERGHAFELRAVRFEDGAVRYSGPDPPLCLTCHGPSARPLWPSYDYPRQRRAHWPGAYGSTHDKPRLDAREHEAFQRFQAAAPDHPRYRHLQLADADAAYFPYADRSSEHRLRPNNRLGNLLARLNARRIAHRLTQQAFFNSHPRAALLWLLDCPQSTTARFAQGIAEVFHRTFPTDTHPSGQAGAARSAPGTTLARMMERLLSAADVDGWDLRLPAPDDRSRYSTGQLRMRELVAARVLEELAGRAEWVRPYYRPWRSREVYDAFAPGYYDRNVAPGGVGEIYDSLGVHYDPQAAARACAPLSTVAAAELAAAAAVAARPAVN